ncbi:HAD family hydrolase [Carnobacterium gallinarum]|uniref:HAD family hydrolase n=1 Tax=Carnobacterium gallinarum TaxID=2749 RepID=UPI000A05183A|nr:HAD family hydrolase [Carnobacterium gallinarum]
MKKVLFTDLDGTILFSKNSLPADLSDENCEIIETYSNGQHGYMERQTWAYLANWSINNYLIPVTTRSTEQYQRLETGLAVFNLPYALTSNGGNLYRFGQLDESWHQDIRLSLANELKVASDALTVVKQFVPAEFIRKIKQIDTLYFCLLVVERIWESERIREVNQLLQPLNWHAYFQHKKLYVLPIPLSKENAIKKLKKEWSSQDIKIHKTLAMGDTTMDYHMLLQQENYLYFGIADSLHFKLRNTPYSFKSIQAFLD